MLVQCRDDLGSGLGFKLSYPDDALSLARDSEKEGKTTAHGNVAALAQLAEDARIDFRVLVLTRDLARRRALADATQRDRRGDLLGGGGPRFATRTATPRWRGADPGHYPCEARRCTPRRWPASGGLSRRPFESQARILADQECILAAQLRALDGAFWRRPCSNWCAAAAAQAARATVRALSCARSRRKVAPRPRLGRARRRPRSARTPPACGRARATRRRWRAARRRRGDQPRE